MPEGLPPASEKLRTVLDYVPCEACLSQRVAEQELLCSICHRLDREVGVRVAVHTTVLVDRPTAALAVPVVIPPPGVPAPPASAPALPVVVVRFVEAGAKPKKEKGPAPGVVEVFVEPIPAPPVAAAPEEDANWEDVVGYEAPSDAFAYTGPAVVPRQEPAPVVVAEPAVAEPVPEDDFVFRPPPQEEAAQATESVASEELDDAWMPAEEVPVRSESQEESRQWERPAESAVEEAPVLEEAPPQDAEVEEEPILEATLVEEDDVVETTMVEDEGPAPAPVPEPAPASASDLWKLRGFDAPAEKALAGANIVELAHLSGHDATELAERTALDARRLASWIDVADLKEEVGVPLEAALALVAAGIGGPRGLRDADPEEIVDKVAAFGGSSVQLKDVKRWKRRA